MADNTIRFLLNNQVKTITKTDPNMTVLQYLRTQEQRTGTKEGCASGDCGACTVVLAEIATHEIDGQVSEELRYKSVNACITLLPALHGKQLITVEDLKDGDRLHPVQQAMVDHHGSQCGFCTPGFVMSLFALHKNFPEPKKEQTLEALAGNLCRCTGYRAILDAAVAAKNHGEDQFDRQRSQTIAQLKNIQQQTLAILAEGQRQVFSPATLEELANLLTQHPDARLLAGGTDLVLEITQQLKSLESIIYLGNVAGLKTMEESTDSITIGAALPYCDFTPRLHQEYPEFGAMIERIGSLQIRNQGTLGGNIGNASPIADMPPVLIALGATLELRQGQQQRQLPLQDYFVDYKVTAQQPGEFIQAVNVPKVKTNQHLKIYKVSKRIDDDISAVLAAFNLCIEDKGDGDKITSARVAFGGMAAIPKRASHCEAALLGQPWQQSTIENAMAALDSDFTPLSDVRASAGYRMQVAKNLLQKCFIEINEPAAETGVVQYA